MGLARQFRKNLLKDGLRKRLAVLKDTATVAVLDRVVQRIGQGSRSTRPGGAAAACWIEGQHFADDLGRDIAVADGSATLYCSTVDMGQGSTTALAQIAAEALGIEAEAVRVVLPDTDVTPYDMGTLGSRSTFHMGHAVRRAAEEAKAKLAALAAETGAPEGSNLPIAELFRRKYGMPAGTTSLGKFVPDYVPPDHDGLTPNATPY